MVKATGLVGFRYCDNTINFTVADPEIELDGDDNSRLIFRVNGTDGTAFPDQRAVMVKLLPGQAESRLVVNNGNGTTTVSYVKIPGLFLPTGGPGYSPTSTRPSVPPSRARSRGRTASDP